MSLLTNIRDLAADPSVPLETVLLKFMVLADELGDETLVQWISQELGGYQQRIDVPSYRMMHGQADAKVSNGYWHDKIDVSNISLPSTAPADTYDRLNTVWFKEGVRELEVLQHRDDLVHHLDGQVKYFIEQSMRKSSGYRVREAFIAIPPGTIAGILGAIRSRVLLYVFRLRKDYPELDTETVVDHIPSPMQLMHIYNVTIGEGSAVSLGGDAYSQNIRQKIVAGDLASLKAVLLSQGVEQSDLDALDAVVAESTPADLEDEQSQLRRWIAQVGDTAAAGGTELAKTASKELIQQAIKYFFGLAIGG